MGEAHSHAGAAHVGPTLTGTQHIPIRTPQRVAEVSWFAPLCNDDYEHLGVPDPFFKSTFAHTADIAKAADRFGFNNMLCPSSYQVGQDTLLFAAGVAPQLNTMALLTAVRCGELHPLMLARSIATLDHMLRGRLTVNIISSEMPGEVADSALRYRRSKEVIEILKQCWNEDAVNYQGEFYRFADVPTTPIKAYQGNGGPLLYFGGMSPDAMDLCAQHCDVFLMWPETEDRLEQHMKVMSEKAARYGRTIDFGLRVHMIVRETEHEARQAAQKLVSKLDDAQGAAIRARALDAKSYGVARQAQMRDLSDDEGFVEPLLWTGIGRARSGCSCALVGDPDQIVAKLNRYLDMGLRAFIFSGYPHRTECELVARHVLPRLPRGSMPQLQKRIPTEEPQTPLAAGRRQ